jgi:thymidylate kinase
MSFTIVSIEGNIGSGKSTLLKNLKKHIDMSSDTSQNIIFLKEPVEEWETIKDSNNKTMLEKFYADQEKYSFPFQMMAYISRLVYMKEAIESNPNAIIITERSLYTDKEVFAKMLFDDKKIEDVNYQIYLKWFDVFAKDYPVSKVIYVKADPEVCYDRIHKRNRNGEESIPLEYLKTCDIYHNEMINNCSKKEVQKQLILDGNIDIKNETNDKQMNQWIYDVLQFIVL